jgi:outer membrane protein W
MTRMLMALAGAALLTLGTPRALAADSVDAGTAGAASISGRHAAIVHAGVFNHSGTEASVAAGSASTRVNGFGGSFSYGYGMGPEWMMGVTAGWLDGEVRTSIAPGSIASRSASVTPILFDVRWYPRGLALGGSGRPFLGVGLGPYVGSAKNTVVGTVVTDELVRETVAGGRAQAGVDWFVGRRFLLELSGGYHVVGTFEQQIGDETDYSGAEFMAGFGVLFGGAR